MPLPTTTGPVETETGTADGLLGPNGYRYRGMVLVVLMVADVMDLLDSPSRTSPAPRSGATSAAARPPRSGC